jgi:hypothetical protein
MEKAGRSRSKAACQFCRTRKLKCDNLQPECSACRAREIRCEYVTRTPAPRPSNAAIQALQAENQRLRRLLEASSNNDTPGNDYGEDQDDEIHIDPHSPTPTAQSATDAEHQAFGQTFQSSAHLSAEGSNADGLHPNSQNQSAFSQSEIHEQEKDHDSTATPHSWNDFLGGADGFPSPLDPTTKDVLRSQLVAASARQRNALQFFHSIAY